LSHARQRQRRSAHSEPFHRNSPTQLPRPDGSGKPPEGPHQQTAWLRNSSCFREDLSRLLS
jgi:hypothetical protein